MSKLKNDTKIIKLEAAAEGYHSGAKAYGEFYLTEEVFKLAKDFIKDFYLYVYDIDGKHSETLIKDITVKEMSLLELVKEGPFDYSNTEDITDTFEEKFAIGLSEYLMERNREKEFNVDLYNLSASIRELKKDLSDKTEKKISKDLEIKSVEVDGEVIDIVIPSGTIIKVQNNENEEYEVEVKHY